MVITLLITLALTLLQLYETAERLMFGMMRSLQFMLHLAFLRLDIPINFYKFIEILIPTIAFDLLEALVDWEDQSILTFNWKR